MIVLLGLLYQVVETFSAGDHGEGTNNLSADNQDQTNGTNWDAVHKGKECKSDPKFNPRYQRGRGICHALIDDKGICRCHRGIINSSCEKLQCMKRSKSHNVQCPLIDELYPFWCQYGVAAIQDVDSDPATTVQMDLHKYQGMDSHNGTQDHGQRSDPSQSMSMAKLRQVIAPAPIQAILNPSDRWEATHIAGLCPCRLTLR